MGVIQGAATLQLMKMIKIFHDPTPGGIINKRLVAHIMTRVVPFTNLTEVEVDEFIYTLLLVAKKLVGTWKHLKQYSDTEDGLIKQAEASKSEANRIETLSYSQDLFLEFDEFLVQLKSTLDYLVKIPNPIVGRNRWNLHTFGEKGDRVIKALRSLPNEWKERAKHMEVTVIERHKPWLTDVINARDMINHYLDGGVKFEHFMVSKQIKDGREVIIVPMNLDDQTMRESIHDIYTNLFLFVEDFIVSFVALRLKLDEYAMRYEGSPLPSIRSSWEVISLEEFQKAIKQPDCKKVVYED